jgi:predicted nuclease of predicted toxin-antitoxin system
MDVRDVGLRGRPDDEIASFARQQNLVVLSADLGFGNIQRFPIGSHPGMAIVRLPNEMPSGQINEAVAAALQAITIEEIRGGVLVIEAGRIRLRRR